LTDIPPPAPAWTWQEVLVASWLAGALLWWALAAARLRRFGRLLRQARPAPAAVAESLRRMAGRMGLRRCPGAWLLPAPVSPLLLAVGRTPRVLLPEALWPRLTAGQRDAILAHELAHLRRGDHWVRRLELLVMGLYWWFPLAWYARRRLQEAEEQCCDAYVVRTLPGSAADYAAALVETLAFVSARPLPLPASASGATQVPMLKRRLTMIMRDTPPVRLGPLGLLAVLGAAVLLPLLPTWAQGPTPPPPDKVPAAQEPTEDKLLLRPPPAVPVDRTHKASLALLQHLQHSCQDCHTPGIVKEPLPPNWKPAHDDLAAIYDWVRKQTAAPAPADVQERAQEVRDEIELKRARLRVKEYQLQSTRRAAERAAERMAKAEKAYQQGALPVSDMDNLREAAETLQSQAHVQEAELEVDRVSLQQAQRRLQRLQEAARAAPGAREADPQEQRMRALQKRAEQLLQELEAIRREIKKARVAGPEGYWSPPR
jgi:beta-lactamase regulating signal transducer with metallopeptidase domain